MKNWYIKALKQQKEQNAISIGHKINRWKKGRGNFNEALYLQITKIKAQ